MKKKNHGSWKPFRFKIYFTYESFNGYDLRESTTVDVLARNEKEGVRLAQKAFRKKVSYGSIFHIEIATNSN